MKKIFGLLILLVLTSGLVFNASCKTTTSGKSLAAIINGEKITQEQLDKEYKKISKRFQGLPQGAMADEQKRRMQKQLLFTLMEKILLEQQAKKNKINIGDKEIKARFKQFQTGRSKKEFEDQLKKAGITETDLRAQIKDNLIREKLRQKVVKTKKPSDKEMEEYYRKNKNQFQGAEGKVMPFKEVKFRIQQLLTSQNEQEAWSKWFDDIKAESEVKLYFW